MFRSILAVVIGYLIFGVSAWLLFQFASIDPHAAPDASFLVLGSLYGSLFAFLGGYLSAVIARKKAILHASIVAVIIAAAAIASLFLAEGSHWSELATIFLFAPMAILGGMLRKRGRRK